MQGSGSGEKGFKVTISAPVNEDAVERQRAALRRLTETDPTPRNSELKHDEDALLATRQLLRYAPEPPPAATPPVVTLYVPSLSAIGLTAATDAAAAPITEAHVRWC